MNLGTSGAVRIVGGAISNGGGVVRWAGRSLAPDIRASSGGYDEAAALELLGSVSAGSDALVMLPYVLVKRAPLWDPDLPEVYLGFHWEYTRAEMVRAAVDGVYLRMLLILERLDDVEPAVSVRASGGTFRAAVWREVMAAIFGRPTNVVGDGERTALGAAAHGVFALGGSSTLDATSALAEGADRRMTSVEPDVQLVSTYEQLRTSIAELIAGLHRVPGLFSGAADRAAPTTAGRTW